MRWLAVLAFGLLHAAEPGYVDPTVCRPCHTAIYDSYSQTGMGRSFGPASTVPPLDSFLHTASRRAYSIVERAGSALLRRDPFGIERTIDYVVGSGNHSKTFAHRDESGRLIELPVSWYAESGGSWRMSPGYDRPDHSDFRRELSDSCMFCHNGYPSAANNGLAMGIDCQRCHGPGEAHAARRGPIVNPGKLARDRGFEVCLQCHLESASRTLPDAVRRPGRAPFSFRPGEPLADYITYYEFSPPPSDDRITVNGAGIGLLKSACYLRSGGRMQCTTCHDPHRRDTSEARYTAICRSCHAQSHEPARTACTSCHMQKRRTEDAVHVVMTDHRIRRGPLPGDLLAPLAERHDRMQGAVRLLYPPQLPDTPETRLQQAMAQRDPRLLATAIAETKTQHAEPYLILGESLRAAGRAAEAIRAFRIAADKSSEPAGALVAAAELLIANNNAASAIALLEPATARLPRDTKLLNSLAIAYVDRSRFGDARRLLDRAVALDANDPLSWLNLGVAREASGDRAGALAAYRRSLALQPDLVRARRFVERLTAAGDGRR